MRELVTKTIDDKLYEFQQFNTTKSLKTLSKLTKFLGEPIMLGLAALGVNPAKNASAVTAKSLLDRELNAEGLAKAVAALVDRIDETEVVDLIKTLTTESVLCDHKPIVFDEHFRGDIGHLFKVIGAALEAQYGNFLGAVTGR